MPDPESLRDPVGHPDQVHEPEVRAHREQVADALVGHRPRGDVRVPQVHRPPEERTRVEVEVLLGVGGDVAGRRQQERHVREQRERQRLEQAAVDAASRRVACHAAVPAVAVMPGAMLGGARETTGAPVPGRAHGLR